MTWIRWAHSGGPTYCKACAGRCAGNGGCNEPEILEENDELLALFLACSTQWRRSFSGHRTGLHYPGVEVVASKRGVALDSEMFSLLQAMESEIVTLDRETHGDKN